MSKERNDAKKGFGISEAEDKGKGQTKYDKPSKPEDDVAIDERRDKPIRGPEPYDGDRD
ncbi:hypothetical protein PARPLA_00444 [Rhodobacteraceae bacterium THAF1]|uniref:hypothetical protein n=1 Tax=Palleronia sp. THAF1 TaxID=2587842 RepID=UPI000F3C1BE7|nr:hypothetical protein [Palleronia sp. THAF1]QFU09993.1 hypothetical protein FIU81_15040 [Palleronia sp. THAF1]VDC17102.1 hypothetical protein PARPLA_00444 [Rhodobacteraceae bacterium THAF1]